MAELTDIRELVREQYASLASGARSCCGSDGSLDLGCGVPTAVADLHEGETVLDLVRAPAPTS